MKYTKKTLHVAAAIVSVGLVTLSSGLAHRQWILPSTSVLSGENQWISVDAAISNDLFFPNHHAIPLSRLQAISPTGKSLELQNASEGKIRTAFELLLEEAGTYRIFSQNEMMFAHWTEDGEPQRARATAEEMEARDLDSMEALKLATYMIRVESIVTCGEPTDLKLTNTGLEFEFVSHPNDLFSGETSTFQVVLNGKPAPDIEVTIVKGNDRFRDSVDEMKLTSDDEGMIEIEWSEPGRYWIEASADLPNGEFKGHAMKQGAYYALTVEVLPE